MKSDNNLQNRRKFFKNAAKKALPILGVVALISNPVIAKAMETNPTSCEKNSCYMLCNSGCTNLCRGCTGCTSCSGYCEGTCLGCEGQCTGCTGCSINCYGQTY